MTILCASSTHAIQLLLIHQHNLDTLTGNLGCKRILNLGQRVRGRDKRCDIDLASCQQVNGILKCARAIADSSW